MNYSIGFRLKFDGLSSSEIELHLLDYLKIFNRYEIKVTKEIVFSKRLELILKLSERYASDRYSIHLFKDLLICKESYSLTNSLLNSIGTYKRDSNLLLITHLPPICKESIIDSILAIQSKLPNKCILLLENEPSSNLSYLYDLNELCQYFDKNRIENIGICLDIGHLLFGFYKSNSTQIDCFGHMETMTYLISRIKEIHIHDFHYVDHLMLNKGMMDLNRVALFIVRSRLNVPIIIEANIPNPRIDGVEQIGTMKHLLDHAEEVEYEHN